MNAHRAECRRTPHHLGRLAHVSWVANIPLGQSDVDVTESFGQATDFGKRRLAVAKSRRWLRLVQGVDKTAGKANGQDRCSQKTSSVHRSPPVISGTSSSGPH